ncbi:hypothetical protein DNH61_11775 [Paenibacillus sambharensis]|uniref:Uncharacterized protein n=1 Tax=Paenibacillus sambharensis TaxID=1803190 RepID=A0A2W1LJP8_9BACL|nr:hypothetical protein [Paenibacillus sambharensis]PZD95232.1 hypothetical protein DNH61_11775 [Paenibacillus sambharensis]
MAVSKQQITDAQLDEITKSTAETLAEQPKRKIRIWMSQEERKRLESSQEAGKKVEWPYEFVSINGHNYQIQRGVEVEVPESVAEILSDAGLI